jgi:predicted dehydrogenase
LKARIGIVGTGWWATQFHIPGLLSYEDAEVVALADPNEERLRAAAQAFGIERTHRDHRELLEAGGVDGVVVATQHAYHYEAARDALDAGVHVMVEKPMVLRAADAWDLVERAERGGLHLTVGYTYHYTRHAARAKQAFERGELGELVAVSGLFASIVESYYRGRPEEYREMFDFPLTGPSPETYSNPALAGGGQGQTQVTHAMGMVFWLTGARATEVSAYMESRDAAVDLADAISYRLDSGAVGTMASTGTLRPGQPQQQEFRYYGTEGFLLQELVHGKLSIHRNDGTSEVLEDLADDELYDAHSTGRALVDLILGRGENRAPGEAAARTVEFLEAAYRSAGERRPVHVA